MESKENVFLKTPWSLEELSVVEEGVKGRTIAQAIDHLKGLLPLRSKDSIRSRVYEFTLEDRTNKRLQKAKKAIEKKKLLANLENKVPEETEVFKENVIDEEEMVITSIDGDLKTRTQAISDNGPKLAYTDELIVKQGVITIPFMGEVRCNFRITGTFFIEKLD
jgi:hypothetical protein